ncbi:hypothetical protein M1738_25135, partial [Salmonella enterica subsp. enterica serovar Javiana]|nr:hypothetical protein [Salmonella enterica subsp. enterica serovar Javiana]
LIKLKRAETEGNTEDVEYYKSLIADLDALIGEEEQTPAPGRRFKLAAPEEGTLVAKDSLIYTTDAADDKSSLEHRG